MVINVDGPDWRKPVLGIEEDTSNGAWQESITSYLMTVMQLTISITDLISSSSS